MLFRIPTRRHLGGVPAAHPGAGGSGAGAGAVGRPRAVARALRALGALRRHRWFLKEGKRKEEGLVKYIARKVSELGRIL